MAAARLFFAVAALTLVDVVLCRPDADRENVGIIGGHKIRIEMVPFMASLRLNGTYHWCGASIIHEQYVLTAAHCIKPNREFKVLVGTDHIDGDGELYEIEEIKKHEKYNEKSQDYDFCLIKLKKPLTFSSKVARIKLADTSVKFPKRTVFNVTGWGATGPDVPVSPKLLQVEIPKIKKQECRMLYALQKHIITSHMVCAGNPGHDSCQGDSGGPLTLGDVQVGVTSFGIGCGGTMPGVYAKVASVYSWIMNVTK